MQMTRPNATPHLYRALPWQRLEVPDDPFGRDQRRIDTGKARLTLKCKRNHPEEGVEEIWESKIGSEEFASRMISPYLEGPPPPSQSHLPDAAPFPADIADCAHHPPPSTGPGSA